MFQLSHMTAQEAVALRQCLTTLQTDRGRIFWSTTQTNNNDWHCRIVQPTPTEVQTLAALMRANYHLEAPGATGERTAAGKGRGQGKQRSGRRGRCVGWRR